MFANAAFTGGRATARSHERTGVEVACSPAVSDGTCEAACACRITRVRHSSANSEVIHQHSDLSPATDATRGAASASPTCSMRSVAARRLNMPPFAV